MQGHRSEVFSIMIVLTEDGAANHFDGRPAAVEEEDDLKSLLGTLFEWN